MYFTIYIHYGALILVRDVAGTGIFQKEMSAGKVGVLREALGAAASDHFFDFVYKGGAVGALKKVFPLFASERPATLTVHTVPLALQPQNLLGRLARGITLLLLDIISESFLSASDFCEGEKEGDA